MWAELRRSSVCTGAGERRLNLCTRQAARSSSSVKFAPQQVRSDGSADSPQVRIHIDAPRETTEHTARCDARDTPLMLVRLALRRKMLHDCHNAMQCGDRMQGWQKPYRQVNEQDRRSVCISLNAPMNWIEKITIGNSCPPWISVGHAAIHVAFLCSALPGRRIGTFNPDKKQQCAHLPHACNLHFQLENPGATGAN